jgi:hypothetical protein
MQSFREALASMQSMTSILSLSSSIDLELLGCLEPRVFSER